MKSWQDAICDALSDYYYNDYHKDYHHGYDFDPRNVNKSHFMRTKVGQISQMVGYDLTEHTEPPQNIVETNLLRLSNKGLIKNRELFSNYHGGKTARHLYLTDAFFERTGTIPKSAPLPIPIDLSGPETPGGEEGLIVPEVDVQSPVFQKGPENEAVAVAPAALASTQLGGSDQPPASARSRPSAIPQVLASTSAIPPEILDASDSVADFAGKSGRSRGIRISPEQRKAIEECAMAKAKDYFSKAWPFIKDVHSEGPFDLLCSKPGDHELLHVEVKGTTSDGSAILLTPNEVEHARQFPNTALFILANVQVTVDSAGKPQASGGNIKLFNPWDIAKCVLEELGFRCFLYPPI